MKDQFRIQTILTAQELLDKAFHKASRSVVDDPDPFYQRKKTAVARLNSAKDTIDTTLGKYVKAFPSFENLHPFLKEMVGLAIDLDEVKRSLGAIQWASETISDVCRKATDQINRTSSVEFIERKRREAYGRISSIVNQVAGDLERLGNARDVIRWLPAVDPHLPTVVVAGAPNVGKSALVRHLSTAKPTVAQYPFTTKEIHVGYFEDRHARYQVIDTPGLLEREPAERNDIERRAAAALRHLDGVVVFLIDPTETCGFALKAQERLLDMVRQEFSHIPFIVVETKCDMLDSGSERIKVSGETGAGTKELQEMLARRLVKKREVVDGELLELMRERERKEEKTGKGYW
jgi:nucleolar GTP-binding protein